MGLWKHFSRNFRRYGAGSAYLGSRFFGGPSPSQSTGGVVKGSGGIRSRRKLRRRGRGARTRRRRRRKSGKQDIWAGDSHVVIPTKVRKTRMSKMWKSMTGKLKAEFNQTGRVSSNSESKQVVGFIQHFPIAVISELLNRTTMGHPTNSTWLDDMHCYLTLLNQDSNDCTIWLYSCVLRNDVGNTGINPAGDWEQGLIDEGGASDDHRVPYSTPFQSKKFTTRWKVTKVQRFVLSSGAQHIHHVAMYPKHKINRNRYNNTGVLPTGTGAATNGVNYLTACTMFVVLGGLTNSAANKTQVGFGESAVDYAASWRYQAHGFAEDKTIFYKNVSYPVLTAPQIIQEKTGVVQAIVNA